MSKFNDGGPAFPDPARAHPHGHPPDSPFGMTMRAYAAIKLKVPESGIDWLDGMIEQSRWDDYAAAALQGYVSGSIAGGVWPRDSESAEEAAMYADAMLAERRKRLADNSTKEQDQ